MDVDTKKRVGTRLRRIAGQVGGIERMVGEDRYCVDVLLQVAAARAALDQVGKVVLQAHVETCVADALASGRPRERKQKIGELMEVFSRYARIRSR